MALGIDRGERVGIWAPNCPEWTMVQYATAKIGAILVNINPAYRTHELAYVLKQSGIRTLISATSFKTSDYVSMVDEVRAETPQLQEVLYLGTDDWRDLVDKADAIAVDELRARLNSLDNTQPINIQYTSGTTGFPKGATLSHRNILNNGYFTTELINFGPDRPAVYPGAVLPLLRHGDGQSGVHEPRCHHGDPRTGLRSGTDAGCHRKRKVYRRLRSADDVHRDARSARPRAARPVVAANGRHGRVGLSRRGHEALRQRHEHVGARHRVRDDRDVAGVVSNAHRRRPRTAYQFDRPGPPARRDQDRRRRNR